MPAEPEPTPRAKCVIHGRRDVVETVLGVGLCKPCARLALRKVLEQADEDESPQLALAPFEREVDDEQRALPAAT